jgi:hypothetical protein
MLTRCGSPRSLSLISDMVDPALRKGDERAENDAAASADFHGFELSRGDQPVDRSGGDVELLRCVARRNEQRRRVHRGNGLAMRGRTRHGALSTLERMLLCGGSLAASRNGAPVTILREVSFSVKYFNKYFNYLA